MAEPVPEEPWAPLLVPLGVLEETMKLVVEGDCEPTGVDAIASRPEAMADNLWNRWTTGHSVVLLQLAFLFCR